MNTIFRLNAVFVDCDNLCNRIAAAVAHYLENIFASIANFTMMKINNSFTATDAESAE